jgi:hypothetical protein
MAFALKNPYRRTARSRDAAARTPGSPAARDPDYAAATETGSTAPTETGNVAPTETGNVAPSGPGNAAPSGRARIVVARGAWAIGSVMVAIARVVRLIAGIVVAVIVVAILLRVVGANASNSIVHDIHDAGRALVGPFHDVFSIKRPKISMAVNWGLAALVYLIIGGMIARLIVRAAPRGEAPRGTAPVA